MTLSMCPINVIREQPHAQLLQDDHNVSVLSPNQYVEQNTRRLQARHDKTELCHIRLFPQTQKGRCEKGRVGHHLRGTGKPRPSYTSLTGQQATNHICNSSQDKWIGTVETATEHQLHWPKNLMPSWMATLRSRTWLTQPALNIIDQRFARCANKIAVVVPLSEIIDLRFDDSEDGDEGEEEVIEVDAPVGPNTSSNSKAAEKEEAPQTAPSQQIKRELQVFKPNIHKLNDPRVRFSVSLRTKAKRAVL